MSYECFDVTIEDKVAHIQMKRGDKRNSMIPSFWTELPEIIKDIDDNAKARVIVLSSTGPHFCAGLDLSSFAGVAGGGADDPLAKRTRGMAFYDNVKRLQAALTVLESCRIPVIAAIQGGAIGGGVDLITACAMRYGTADSFITIYEIEVGMTADVGTFPRICKLIPEGIVHELAYTGRRMPADECKQVGLYNAVYPDQETMLAEVMKLARDIAAKPPLAIYGCKRMINYARDHSVDSALDYIGIWNASNLQIEEIMESMAAKAEKRAGVFADLPKKAS